MLAEQIDIHADFDLRHNYMALKLATVEEYTPERALSLIAGMSTYPEAGSPTRTRTRRHSDADISDMAKMRNEQRMTYTDIGSVYCVSASAIYKALKYRGLLQPGIIGKPQKEGIA
jgi:hypothetical protein